MGKADANLPQLEGAATPPADACGAAWQARHMALSIIAACHGTKAVSLARGVLSNGILECMLWKVF